jgi:hypothetical protein
MKNLILIFAMITLNKLGFSQDLKQSKKDTLSVSIIKERPVHEINKTKPKIPYDSARIEMVSDAFYKGFSKMSEEEKKLFISNFVFERGHFKIPE